MSGDQRPRPTESLPRDAVFELLGHHRRRLLLACLEIHGDPLALADVAEQIAVAETDASIAEIDPESVKRVYMSLYHAHVRKLADYDVVTYDQDQDLVAAGARAPQLTERLDLGDGETLPDPW